MPMRSSSNGTTSFCQSKVEGEVVSSSLTRCVCNLLLKKEASKEGSSVLPFAWLLVLCIQIFHVNSSFAIPFVSTIEQSLHVNSINNYFFYILAWLCCELEVNYCGFFLLQHWDLADNIPCYYNFFYWRKNYYYLYLSFLNFHDLIIYLSVLNSCVKSLKTYK